MIFWVAYTSTCLLLKPISYDEMRSRHFMDPQEIQFVRNKSPLETKKRRCSILEDFFFSELNELELLEKSD